MHDIEVQLSQWLQNSTPEPPYGVRAADIFAAAEPPVAPRRTWTPLLAPAALVAMVALVAAVAVLVSRSSHGRVPPAVTDSAPPTPSPTAVGAPAQPPPDFDQLRIIGSNGTAAWQLTDALEVSTDGGGHWATAALPAGLPASAVSSINVDNAGNIWIANGSGRTGRLYERPANSTAWHEIDLPLTPPPGNSGGPVSVAIDYAANGIVAVVASWPTQIITEYNELLLSTHDGADFAHYPMGIDRPVTSVTFLSGQVGLAVGGTADNILYRTADGGRTWHALFGTDNTTNTSYGRPTRTGSEVAIARITGVGTGETVTMMTSSDLGAHFTAVPAPPLRVSGDYPSGDYGVLDVAIKGTTVWVPVYTKIYESSDLGRTWTAVPTESAINSVTIVGNGIAIAQSSSICSSNKPIACFLTSYLVVTTDNGRNWNAP